MKKSLYVLLLGSLMALSACQSVKIKAESIHKSSFIGERILWPDKISPQVNTVTINIVFPPHYKILEDANPAIKLMTAEGKLIEERLMEKLPFTLTLNKPINSAQLLAYISIYYCRDDEVGMCLKKNVLVEFNIDKHSSIHALNINYPVKEVVY